MFTGVVILENHEKASYLVDLPHLMNFKVEYVRPQSGRCLGREAAETKDFSESLASTPTWVQPDS